MIQAAKRAPSSKRDKIGDEQFLCGDSGSFVHLPSKRAHGGDRENVGERRAGILECVGKPTKIRLEFSPKSRGRELSVVSLGRRVTEFIFPPAAFEAVQDE